MESASNTQRAHLALFMCYLVLSSVIVWALGASRAAPGLVVVGVVGALHLAIAIGAGARKEWARIASLATGCLMLIGFPIGTMIGLYLIINARSDWALERPRYSGSLTDGWPVRAGTEAA